MRGRKQQQLSVNDTRMKKGLQFSGRNGRMIEDGMNRNRQKRNRNMQECGRQNHEANFEVTAH